MDHKIQTSIADKLKKNQTKTAEAIVNAEFSFEATGKEAIKVFKELIPILNDLARNLDTESLFGTEAGIIKNFSERISKYPDKIAKKIGREVRKQTETETKEEKKSAKAKAIREKIQKYQDQLARL